MSMKHVYNWDMVREYLATLGFTIVLHRHPNKPQTKVAHITETRTGEKWLSYTPRGAIKLITTPESFEKWYMQQHFPFPREE